MTVSGPVRDTEEPTPASCIVNVSISISGLIKAFLFVRRCYPTSARLEHTYPFQSRGRFYKASSDLSLPHTH